MTQDATSAVADSELQRALDELEASRERVYYDADADASVRAGYYEAIDESESPEQLFVSLGARIEHTHEPRPSYKPAERVYPWVDLHPDGRLRSIYSGKPFEAEKFIRADAEIAQERSARLQELTRREPTLGPREFEAAFDALERELPFNCEHVVPQSWFSKREPMRGDLHHLFACESRCNSVRGNTPYVDFPAAEAKVVSDCGRSELPGFEPAAGKGPVARATLYFLLRYPGQIGDEARELQRERVSLLLEWHRANQVEEYERHRNAAIAELQGNRNPLIDHPEWADRIDFDAGFDDSGAAVAAHAAASRRAVPDPRPGSQPGSLAATAQDLLVVGDRVALGPLRRDLASSYARWINQLDTRFNMLRVGIATADSEIAWVEETTKAAAEREPTVVAFTVYDRRDLAPVGTGMLFRVSHVHESAMLGLGLGERRGQGLGTEATRLMLDWAFNVLGLEYVSLETLPSNTAAIRAYERAGFTRIGVRHSAVMTGGQRHDVVLMEAIKADFSGSRLLPTDPGQK
jgi:endonuclease I/RimJ/RimL family protein N-acetyltransferase